MKALETQLVAMLGRFHIEVKAIIGFARLAAGDSFEITIKHGAQRWKTRGKTQADRTQAWDQTTTVFNCSPSAPIHIKVIELRFFKSKCLNERSFETAKFFSPQPQLVTMNLNSIGSLKLQLVITWLPLLSSKSAATAATLLAGGRNILEQQCANGISRSMACIPVAVPPSALSHHHAKQASSVSQLHDNNFSNVVVESLSKCATASRKSPSSGSGADAEEEDRKTDAENASPTLRRVKRNKSPESALITSSISFTDANNNNNNNNNGISHFKNNFYNGHASAVCPAASAVVDDAPPKICLREKKRQRRNDSETRATKATNSVYSSIGGALDKDRWRHSSTTILDSLYRDLSKDIPTIDDLAVLSTTRTNLRKKSAATKNGRPMSANERSVNNNEGVKLLEDVTNRTDATAAERHQADNKSAEKRKKSVAAENEDASNNQNLSCWLSSPSKASENSVSATTEATTSSSSSGSVNGSAKKNRLSSLKRNRHNKAVGGANDFYAKVPMLPSAESTALNASRLPPRPFSTICNADELLLDAQQKTTRQSGASPSSQNNNAKPLLSAIEESLGDAFHEALNTANALLAQIETLRALLLRTNSPSNVGNELAELVNFEASMLNWEAMLKLNRASILEDLRMCRLSSASALQNGRGIFSKRGATRYVTQKPPSYASDANAADKNNNNNWSSTTNYYQHRRNFSHSPSTASDEVDGGGELSGCGGSVATCAPPTTISTMDQISENDSGIDSLRQQISPYNNHLQSAENGNNSCAWKKNLPPSQQQQQLLATSADDASQNRFKQFKDRRKSLGVILDAIHPTSRRNSSGQCCVTPFSPPLTVSAFENTSKFDALSSRTIAGRTLYVPPSSCVSSASSSSGSRRSSASNAAVQPRTNATGHAEADECLSHHFQLAIRSLEKIIAIQLTPFEFTLTELLCQIEQDTVALEMLRNIVLQLPAQPNLCNLFADLGASEQLRDIWLAATFSLKNLLILPAEMIRHRIRLFVQPIVTARRYPQLVNNVVDAIMNFMCERNGKWESTKVTLFQFAAFFNAKDLPIFIENVSHEAWITVNLDSRSLPQVREVMERLRKVPVVPPLQSLRHIALVLATCAPGSPLVHPIEKYLKSASTKLTSDLAASFMCILEHDHEPSRIGACKVLAILKQENTLNHLQFLALHDASEKVRDAAHQTIVEMRQAFVEHEEFYGDASTEITKI